MDPRAHLKRSAPDELAPPDSKRAKTEDSLFPGFFGSPNELDIHALKFQNRELVSRFKAQRSEIDRLQYKIKHQAVLERRIGACSRIFDQMIYDLSTLAQAGGIDTTSVIKPAASGIAKSFLLPLTSDIEDADTNGSEAADMGVANEQAILGSYSEAARLILSPLLSALQQQSTSVTDASLRQENDRLISENRRLEIELGRVQLQMEAVRTKKDIGDSELKHYRETAILKSHEVERIQQEMERVKKATDAAVVEAQLQAQAAQQAAATATANSEGSGSMMTEEQKKEIDDMKTALELRTKEIAELQEKHAAVLRQTAELQTQLYEASNREPQVTTSPEYQALLRQQEIHEADKARLVADVINLRRDLDEKSITLRVLESSRAPTQNELTIRMNEIRQLTERLKTSEHEKEALEQKVEEAKTAQHSPELVQSLLDRNAGLTTESAALRKQLEESKLEAENLRTQISKLSDSSSAKLVDDLSAAEEECKQKEAKLDEYRKLLENWKAAEKKWHEKDQEYNTVIRTYQTTKSAELNQLVDLKTQNSKFTEDNSRLTDENARLKSQVEGLGPSEAERQLRERVATLEADVASLHKAAAAEKRRADEARRNVEKHKKEAEQYLKEVDALAMEMDTLGQQNVDLQRKAVEADDVRMKVMTSNMKQSFLQSEAQRENQRLQGIVQTKTDKINSLDELIRSLNATITQYSNDVAAANLEKSKALTALEETDKAFKGTLALLDASRLRCTKLMEDMKELREKVAQVEISKVALESQKTKAQEDLTNTQRRLKEKSSLSSSTGASVGGRANQALQSQVELYKQYYFCSLCKTNRVNTVLTQCFHVFCRECIDSNIKNRNRKCPSCSVKFDAVDAKTFYYP